MTNGHCHETYDSDETRKAPARGRSAKVERVIRKAEQPARTETPAVREREPRQS